MVMTNRAPVTQSATADASGNATVTFRTRGSHIWVVSQIGIVMPGAGSVTGLWYFNGAAQGPFYPPDTVGGEPYQELGPGDELAFTVTGATPGTVLTCSLSYNPKT